MSSSSSSSSVISSGFSLGHYGINNSLKDICCAGLFVVTPFRFQDNTKDNHQRHPLALEKSNLVVRGSDNCADVTVTQTYVNNAPLAWCTSQTSSSSSSHLLPGFGVKSSPTIECQYQFPLDENSAVYEFNANVDGRIVKGQIKPKDQAKAEFKTAVSQGKTAMLLQEKAANIFECDIGNIRRGSRCTITIKYVTYLDMVGAENQLVIPMKILPKYNAVKNGNQIKENENVISSNNNNNNNNNMDINNNSDTNTVFNSIQNNNNIGSTLPSFDAFNGNNNNISTTVSNEAVHLGVKCDGCMIIPIIGDRYKCTVCSDFDLCAKCESQGVHDQKHPMMKHRKPARKLETHDGFTCDGCNQMPIRGARYRCNDHYCDYDLCASCYGASGTKRVGHPPSKATNVSHRYSNYNYNNQNSQEYTHHTFSRVFSSEVNWDNIHNYLDEENEIGAHIITQPHSIELDIQLLMQSPIVSVTTPGYDYIQQKRLPNGCGVSLNYIDHSGGLEKDLIVKIQQQKAFEPRAILELDLEKRTAAVQCVFAPPELKEEEISNVKCEFLFLLDRSGSMEGSSIDAVREAMKIKLHALPADCKFNIIGFGSEYQKLFPKSEAYSESSLNQALKSISNIKADLGGTEIFPPLENVLIDSITKTYPRQIFILTDGGVNNREELVQLVSRHSSQIRLFTFGIGDQVDRKLCKQLAEVGGGTCEFVRIESGESLEKTQARLRTTILRQLSKALQPALTDVQMNWGDFYHTGTDFIQGPALIPAIFTAQQSRIYALHVQLPSSFWDEVVRYNRAPVGFEQKIKISALSNRPPTLSSSSSSSHSSSSITEVNDGEKTWEIKLDADSVTTGKLIHRLAARTRIKELEKTIAGLNQQKKKEKEVEIQALALRYSLTSTTTSFIIVYQDSNNNNNNNNEQAASITSKTSSCNSSNSFSAPGYSFGKPSSSLPSCASLSLSGGSSGLQYGGIQCYSASSNNNNMVPKSLSLQGATPSFNSRGFGFNESVTRGSGTKSRSFDNGEDEAEYEEEEEEEEDEAEYEEEEEEEEEEEDNDEVDVRKCRSSSVVQRGSEVSLKQKVLRSFGYENNQELGVEESKKCKSSKSSFKKFNNLEQVFNELVSLQKANGSFSYLYKLWGIFYHFYPTHSSIKSVEQFESLSKSCKVSEDVFITALAIRLLEKYYSGKEFSSSLFQNKAKSWLDTQSVVYSTLESHFVNLGI